MKVNAVARDLGVSINEAESLIAEGSVCYDVLTNKYYIN